jgi:hypothetical protein
VLTAVAGLALTVSTALTWQKDAANTGLIQRGLILVYWSWIVLLGIHLVWLPPQPSPTHLSTSVLVQVSQSAWSAGVPYRSLARYARSAATKACRRAPR